MGSTQNIKAIIREYLDRSGVNLVGFGSVPHCQLEILEIKGDLPRAIVFGFRLSKTVLETITDRPTLIYKHHYKTVNWLLDQTSYHLANLIEDRGYRALAIPASQVVDWIHHKGHISHRHLAVEAGLGHMGRSGLVINPKYGAQVRYTSVLTDLPFDADPKTASSCGSCMKCVAACPAQAIDEKGIDMTKCYNKLDEFVKIRGISQHICGICVRVCDGSD